LDELKKPFAVPTVTFSPDYSDASVRQAMLQQGMSSMGNMFGASAIPPAMNALPFAQDAFEDAFDPEENLDNPAFTSDIVDEEDYAADYQQGAHQEQAYQQTPQAQPQPAQEQPQSPEDTGYYCDGCGAPINEKVYGYSLNKFGKPLCMKCQRGAK